jgi:shikimate dehydrogenase
MAIDKELYERYKKMKAEGVNITLAELKAQIEEERNTNSSTPVQTTYQTTPSYSNEQPVQNSVNTYSSAPEPAQVTPSSYSGNMSQYQPYVSSNYMSQFGTGTGTSTNTVQTATPVQNTYTGNVAQATTEQSAPATKFGLIGYPLGHSLSTYIHDAGFKSSGFTDYTYELLETHPESLVDRIKFLKYGGYLGFNVTIPLKLPICVFLDEIDNSADLVGAVNTVVINSDKTLKGYNTDITGFVNAIPSDVILNGKTAGILGTGGAARAAIAGLITKGVKNFKIYTRNIPNSVELTNYLEKKYPEVKFNPYQIEYIRSLEDVDILVNCTPIGMKGRGAGYSPVEEPELCTLPKHAVVYDVVYNPRKTVLIKLAEKNGYRTVLGLDMLIYQAMEAQKIWTGKTPDFKDMKIAALENLE